MDTLNNIQRLLKIHKKTQKELCEFLGLNGQAFTNWKNGTSESYKKYLPQIAEFLEVPLALLVDEKEIEIPKLFYVPLYDESSKEDKFLNLYRQIAQKETAEADLAELERFMEYLVKRGE